MRFQESRTAYGRNGRFLRFVRVPQDNRRKTRCFQHRLVPVFQPGNSRIRVVEFLCRRQAVQRYHLRLLVDPLLPVRTGVFAAGKARHILRYPVMIPEGYRNAVHAFRTEEQPDVVLGQDQAGVIASVEADDHPVDACVFEGVVQRVLPALVHTAQDENGDRQHKGDQHDRQRSPPVPADGQQRETKPAASLHGSPPVRDVNPALPALPCPAAAGKPEKQQAEQQCEHDDPECGKQAGPQRDLRIKGSLLRDAQGGFAVPQGASPFPGGGSGFGNHAEYGRTEDGGQQRSDPGRGAADDQGAGREPQGGFSSRGSQGDHDFHRFTLPAYKQECKQQQDRCDARRTDEQHVHGCFPDFPEGLYCAAVPLVQQGYPYIFRHKRLQRFRRLLPLGIAERSGSQQVAEQRGVRVLRDHPDGSAAVDSHPGDTADGAGLRIAGGQEPVTVFSRSPEFVQRQDVARAEFQGERQVAGDDTAVRGSRIRHHAFVQPELLLLESVDVVHVAARHNAHVIVHDPVLLCGGKENLRYFFSFREFGIWRIVRGKKGLDPENLKAVHRVIAAVPGFAGQIRKGAVKDVVFSCFRDKTAAAGEQVNMRFFLSLPGIYDVLQCASVIDK